MHLFYSNFIICAFVLFLILLHVVSVALLMGNNALGQAFVPAAVETTKTVLPLLREPSITQIILYKAINACCKIILYVIWGLKELSDDLCNLLLLEIKVLLKHKSYQDSISVLSSTPWQLWVSFRIEPSRP